MTVAKRSSKPKARKEGPKPLRAGDRRHASGLIWVEYKDIRPEPPAGLKPVALAEWNRLVGALRTFGLLTHLDLGALKSYCIAFGFAECLLKKMSKEEAVAKQACDATRLPSDASVEPTHKYYFYLDQYNRQVEFKALLADQLGLTPESRARITSRVLRNDAMLQRRGETNK